MTETTRGFFQVFMNLIQIGLVYILFVSLVLLAMANWALPYFAILKPQIVLAAVFYWTLYRPAMMPPWVIFIAGLLMDAVHPVMPFGTHAFSYLLVSGLLKPRRRMLMGQPFMMVWTGFVAAAFVDVTVKGVVLHLFTATDVGLSGVIANVLMTVLIFPVLLILFVWFHRLLPASRGMISG